MIPIEIFTKYAAIITPLQAHQQDAVERAMKQNLILAHSTGSGKTLTSIAIADALGRPATVLTPASLVENYRKEIEKHKKDGPPIEVMSLPTAVARQYSVPLGNTVIIDEAHALRNPGTAKYNYIKAQLPKANRIVTLTGTPAYNSLSDWSSLVNLTANKPLLPSKVNEFKQRYMAKRKVRPSLLGRLMGIQPGEVMTLQNEKELRNILNKYVHSFQADVEKPKKIEEDIEVPMDKSQQQVYDYLEHKIPWHLRYKIHKNLPPTKRESQSLNAFLSGVRQVSNTAEGFDTKAGPGAKIRKSVEILREAYRRDPENFRALVYSNYLQSGVGSVAKLLDQELIPYEIFSGDLSPAAKKDIVNRYNSGKLPIILGTGSASEGLDLKRTNLIQLLEPHFNNSRLNQVIGRGIRYKSHDDLPPEQRQVKVQRFKTVRKPTFWQNMWGKQPDTSVDSYLIDRAKEKDDLNEQVQKLFR